MTSAYNCDFALVYQDKLKKPMGFLSSIFGSKLKDYGAFARLKSDLMLVTCEMQASIDYREFAEITTFRGTEAERTLRERYDIPIYSDRQHDVRRNVLEFRWLGLLAQDDLIETVFDHDFFHPFDTDGPDEHEWLQQEKFSWEELRFKTAPYEPAWSKHDVVTSLVAKEDAVDMDKYLTDEGKKSLKSVMEEELERIFGESMKETFRSRHHEPFVRTETKGYKAPGLGYDVKSMLKIKSMLKART